MTFHFQSSVPDWPRAVAVLPAGNVVKAIDNVQLLSEAKAHNSGVLTVLRHWYDGGQVFGGDESINEERARFFFDTFIDGTFEQHAHNVDFVEEWNEYNATSHNPQEIAERVRWAEAVAKVWALEYRPRFPHIRLVLANTAIGNDIPWEVARAATDYDAVLSYHVYVPVKDGAILEGEWTYYSGRWVIMDGLYKQRGYSPEWIFTEGGPVGFDTDGHNVWLKPNDGWRHSSVYNADVNGYLASIEYWLDRFHSWNKVNDNRGVGQTLFTSGGGNTWQYFETRQPEMDAIAALMANYDPVDPPPIDPPPSDLESALWDASVEEQIECGVSLNPGALLQKSMFAHGFVPVHTENAMVINTVTYVYQGAETVDGSKPRRVYYAPKPNYNPVYWTEEP